EFFDKTFLCDVEPPFPNAKYQAFKCEFLLLPVQQFENVHFKSLSEKFVINLNDVRVQTSLFATEHCSLVTRSSNEIADLKDLNFLLSQISEECPKLISTPRTISLYSLNHL